MLYVTKNNLITTTEELFGVYLTKPITLDNMTSVDLTNAITFIKTNSSDEKEIFIANEYNKVISHLILRYGGVVVGFVDLLSMIDLQEVKTYQVNINYSTTYSYVQFMISTREQYIEHSANTNSGTFANGDIQHSNFFNNEKITSVANSTKINQLLNNYQNSRNVLSINGDNTNNISYTDNFNSIDSINNKYSSRLVFNHNINYFISLFNQLYRNIIGNDNYIDNTFVGYSPLQGIIIYTIIPIAFLGNNATELMIITSSCNNSNNVNFYWVKNCSFSLSKLKDIQKPLLYFYDTMIYIVTEDFIQETVDSVTTTILEEHFQERVVKYNVIETTTKQIQTNHKIKFGEVSDLSYNGYAGDDNKEFKLINLNGDVYPINDGIENGLSFPKYVYDDNSQLNNIVNNVVVEACFFQEFINGRKYEDIYFFDNFVAHKQGMDIYIYKIAPRNAEMYDINNVPQSRIPLLWSVTSLDGVLFDGNFSIGENVSYNLTADYIECNSLSDNTFIPITPITVERAITTQEMEITNEETIYIYYDETNGIFRANRYYPIFSVVNPINTTDGMLWMDSSKTTPQLFEYRDGWVNVSKLYSTYICSATKQADGIYSCNQTQVLVEYFNLNQSTATTENYALFSKLLVKAEQITSTNNGFIVLRNNTYYLYRFDGLYEELITKTNDFKIASYRGLTFIIKNNGIELFY